MHTDVIKKGNGTKIITTVGLTGLYFPGAHISVMQLLFGLFLCKNFHSESLNILCARIEIENGKIMVCKYMLSFSFPTFLKKKPNSMDKGLREMTK